MSFADISHFYKNFAELYSAGIDAGGAIEALKKNEASPEKAQSLKIASHNLKNGRTLFQSLKASRLVPVFDLPIVKAAEESGRLVDIFKDLAQKHLDTHHAIGKIRQGLIKPYLTFVVVLMFPRVPDLFTQKITLAVYLRQSLGPLFMMSVVFYYLYNFWMQSFFDLQKARSWHSFLSSLPFFNKLSARIAIEKFSSSLAMMLESGIDFFEALKQSSLCSSNPAIQSSIDRAVPKLQAGSDVARTLQSERVFPAEFITAVTLGSQSGKLPEFLRRYSANLKAQNENAVQTVVKFFPVAMYWIAFVMGLFAIVDFYKGYLDEILKIAP